MLAAGCRGMLLEGLTAVYLASAFDIDGPSMPVGPILFRA